MAYNELLANRLREILMTYGDDITEKRMFGGLSFLYKGKMTVGIIAEELVVRVIESKMDHELEKHNTRPMDFTNKPLKEFIYVSEPDLRNLSYWIELGIEHAKSKLNE